MGEKIALGFHTCVDYELIWDPEVIRKAIRDFGIRSAELEGEIRPDGERNVWRMVLAYMKAGIGAEILPDQPEIVNDVVTGLQMQYELALIAGTFEDAYALLAKLSSVLTEGRMSDDKITMWVNLMNYETAYDAGGHAVINTHITAVLEKAKG